METENTEIKPVYDSKTQSVVFTNIVKTPVPLQRLYQEQQTLMAQLNKINEMIKQGEEVVAAFKASEDAAKASEVPAPVETETLPAAPTDEPVVQS